MARNVVVTDIDLGYDAIIEEIVKLEKASLLVGIQEQAKTTSQSKNGRTQKAGQSVAEYAAKNEFGDGNIPERSFMRTAFDENLDLIENATADQYGKIIDGDIALTQGLNVIGQIITGLIQTKIRAIIFPPNSPRTIAMKGSSKPLIDFGQMVKSVTYAIRTKK
jgi:hypothetical protein